LTDERNIQQQLDQIQADLRGKAGNGGAFYSKLVAAAVIPLLAALVGYGALQESVRDNANDISSLDKRIKSVREIAVQTREDVAIIKIRQQKRLKLMQQYTDVLNEVRNSQAQYVGEITSKLQATTQVLNKAAERLGQKRDGGQ